MTYKSINGFTYVEKLSTESFSVLPTTLLLDGRATSESVLFRLLLGTLNLKLNSQEEVIEQNICYNKLQDEFESEISENPIQKWINDAFGLGDLNNYFLSNTKNKALFDELLIEFSLFFFNKNKENHISAFLHLYRALEYMSYSFPMAYSSRTSNFYTSFDTFKGFFTTKEMGQLKFFQEFVQAIFRKSFLRCTTKIDTYVGDELLDSTKRKIIAKLCKDFEFYDNGSIIELEYRYLLDFMVNLRNRYFHFQSDRRDNISNINFNSESFFAALNNKFANWLSIIYLEILLQGVYKSNLLPAK